MTKTKATHPTKTAFDADVCIGSCIDTIQRKPMISRLLSALFAHRLLRITPGRLPLPTKPVVGPTSLPAPQGSPRTTEPTAQRP